MIKLVTKFFKKMNHIYSYQGSHRSIILIFNSYNIDSSYQSISSFIFDTFKTIYFLSKFYTYDYDICRYFMILIFYLYNSGDSDLSNNIINFFIDIFMVMFDIKPNYSH